MVLDREFAPAFERGPAAGNQWKSKNAAYMSQVAIFNKLEPSPYNTSSSDWASRSHATTFARGGAECTKGLRWVRDPHNGTWFRKDWFDKPSWNYSKRKPMEYNPGITSYLQGHADRPGVGIDMTLRRTSSSPGGLSLDMAQTMGSSASQQMFRSSGSSIGGAASQQMLNGTSSSRRSVQG